MPWSAGAGERSQCAGLSHHGSGRWGPERWGIGAGTGNCGDSVGHPGVVWRLGPEADMGSASLELGRQPGQGSQTPPGGAAPWAHQARGPCRTHAGAARRPARGPAAPWQEARVEESSRSTRGRPLHAEPLVAWWPFPTRLQPEPETPEPRPGAFLKRLPLNFPCRRQTQEPAQESGVCVPRRPGAGLAAPRRGDSNLSLLCSLSQASDPGDFVRARRLLAR